MGATTTTTDRPVILTEPAKVIDARSAFAAINGPSQWTMARVGAVDRMYDTTYVQLDMTCGRAKRRLYVTVAPDDTYSLEIGRYGTIRQGMPWHSMIVHRGVDAMALADLVEASYELVF